MTVTISSHLQTSVNSNMQPGSKLSRAQTWESREHQLSKQNSQEPELRVRRFQRAINPRASTESCSTARQNDKTYVLLNFHGAVRLWAKLHAGNYRKNVERWRYRLPKYLTVHKGDLETAVSMNRIFVISNDFQICQASHTSQSHTR